VKACEESAQSVAHRIQGVEQDVRTVEQNVQSVEQVLADLGEQFTLLKRTTDETAGTVSNVAVSVGELNQDVDQLKELRQAIAEAKGEIDALKQMKRAHPVRAAVVTAVSIVLVISGYVMLGMPGWQAVAGYVPWLRG
jgi:CII-binding regulator of phage lambda lysogenization HflD